MFDLDKVPSNLDQALELLDELVKEDKNWLINNGSVSVHHGLGQWLRNNWSLWEKETPLVLWFNKIGVYHADDISALILEAFVAKLRNESYNMQATIDRFNKHWKKFGVDPKNM